MKLNHKNIHIIAIKLDVPQWVVYKAMYELNTEDSDAVEEHIELNTFRSKLIEFYERAEDISLMIRQANLKPEEYTQISLRVNMLKTSCKDWIKNITNEDLITVINKIKENRINSLD